MIDMTATATMPERRIKCGNCKGKHKTVAEARNCYSAKQPADRTFPATPGQQDFVRFLINDRVMEQHLVAKATKMLNRGLTFQEASRIIDYTKPLPRKGKPANKPQVDEGMYQMNGQIYRVQMAVHGSGYLYAKVLVPPTMTGGKPRFKRAPSALYKLRPEHRMTPEQAAEFGALYGFCVVCGRTLTDEQSIAKGIGPICETKV